jgi:hypothetical protein
MNKSNLIVPTSEQARINGRKGGLASAKAKKERKTIREQLLLLLEKGDTQSNMCVALVEKALNGDVKSFEVIRDTIGEKPVDEIKGGLDIKIKKYNWEDEK